MEIFRTQIDRARVRYNAEAQPVKVVPRPLNYNRKPVSQAGVWGYSCLLDAVKKARLPAP